MCIRDSRDPVEFVAALEHIQHPRIPLPVDLYRSQHQLRDNSMGLNLANDDQLRDLAAALNTAGAGSWNAAPLVPGAQASGEQLAVTNPADRREVVGHWQASTSADVERALANAVAAQPAWDATPAASRAALLEHAAELLEARLPAYMAMCTKEAGKTLSDGIAEAVSYTHLDVYKRQHHYCAPLPE